MLVKCRFCGNKIEKKEAYCIKHGKSNWYYCSKEHSVALPPKEECYNVAFEIFGRTTNTLFFKQLKEIADIYSYEEITRYLTSNKQHISYWLDSKSFNNEFGKIKYFGAIIKNNIADSIKKEKEERQRRPKEVRQDVDFVKQTYKRRNSRRGMDSILNDLME